MLEGTVEVIEWHIYEGSASDTPFPPIHMGPFATEEQCRTVLAGLRELPGFQHGALEIRSQARRREKRIRMRLPVQLSRLTAPEKSWEAYTVDISRFGARFTDSSRSLKHGEFLLARYGQREAVFRVTWVGLAGSPSEGHVGVECLSPESELWDVDFSSHTDDEPLLQEIVIARAVQRRLFPREKPKLQTLDYSGKCIQARTVGGDYYDFLDMGAGRVGFVLADVAGKGVAAALLMANLQGSIHNRAGVDVSDLRGFLSGVNLHLFEHTEADRYATLFFGCYHDTDRSLSYVNCGHTPPLLLRREGNAERLEPTATVLGLFGSWDCSVGKTHMQPGDVLSIFTDGITETATANGEEFGEKRLLNVLQQNRHHESIEIVRRVQQALEQFRENSSPQDDLTLVVARGR
jgi:hypothetical protein